MRAGVYVVRMYLCMHVCVYECVGSYDVWTGMRTMRAHEHACDVCTDMHRMCARALYDVYTNSTTDFLHNITYKISATKFWKHIIFPPQTKHKQWFQTAIRRTKLWTNKKGGKEACTIKFHICLAHTTQQNITTVCEGFIYIFFSKMYCTTPFFRHNHVPSCGGKLLCNDFKR